VAARPGRIAPGLNDALARNQLDVAALDDAAVGGERSARLAADRGGAGPGEGGWEGCLSGLAEFV
jgi:hypothetical protein